MLAKTLEAVGRGAQKLHGRIATDDLGALADDTSTVQHSSDADYLADLVSLAEQDAQGGRRTDHKQPPQPPQPQQPPQPYAQPEPAYGYAQQADPYAGYQQQYGGDQDPYAQVGGYGQQQADPYAAYQGYDAQQAYDTGQAAPHVPQQAQQGYALDETSLFDTSMITPEQLEAYRRERGL